MAEKDDEDFENSIKFDNDCVDSDIKVRDHCPSLENVADLQIKIVISRLS